MEELTSALGGHWAEVEAHMNGKIAETGTDGGGISTEDCCPRHAIRAPDHADPRLSDMRGHLHRRSSILWALIGHKEAHN
jgi:hypothetical protein